MHRFTIYRKSNKFYWSNNRIIYPIIIICFTIVLATNDGKTIEKNILNNWLVGIMLLTFTCGIIFRLIGIPKTEPLKGILDGFLIFNMTSIKIDEELLDLEQIRNIDISNEDYYGKLTGYSKGNFNSPRSNGVDNHLKIMLYSGEVKKCNFELYNSNDLQKIKSELINYYLNGKLELVNLANILGEESRREIIKLKSEIESQAMHNR